jgi:hypothetical protein
MRKPKTTKPKTKNAGRRSARKSATLKNAPSKKARHKTASTKATPSKKALRVKARSHGPSSKTRKTNARKTTKAQATRKIRKSPGTSRSQRKGSRRPKTSAVTKRFEDPTERSERDEESFVVAALKSRGFKTHQDVGVPRGRADIYARRGDESIVIEMKKRSAFTSRELRVTARAQAGRYAKHIRPDYIGISDGRRLMLRYKGRYCTHQLSEDAILPTGGGASCPLDLGADYYTYRDFPRRQRAGYKSKQQGIITREPLVDITSLLKDEAVDLVLIAGEPGAGKTTYAWQLAESDDWDPLWLDSSLTDNNPIETLREAMKTLTGFTGDLAPFLRMLALFRKKPRQKPTGIVADAVDEWERVQQTLPILLRFAKSLKYKLLVVGRPQTIDLLINDDKTFQGFSFKRFDLPTFTDQEWKQAEAQHVKAFNLRSNFVGHAEAMSRLPEMMALIAEAYENEAVDPNLTEPVLYEKYLSRKAARIALRTKRTDANIAHAILEVANVMLAADRVSLPYGRAYEASNVTDELIKEGLLRSDGKGRTPYVRFRFGRVRDNILSDKSFDALFGKPIVGRSALTFAALTNEDTRFAFIVRTLAENDLEAASLVREHGWWRELAKVPPTAIKRPILMLAYAREALHQYPELLALAGADPAGLRLASIHRVGETPIPQWKAWLASATDEEQLHQVADLTLALMRSYNLSTEDAIEAIDILRSRLFQDRLLSREGHSFWPLVGEVTKKLSVRDARLLLRRTLPSHALVNSSITMMRAFYPGMDHPNEMMTVVSELRERSTPTSFEAWASSTLLAACMTEWPGFRGFEYVGHGSDIAWLVQTTVPALAQILSSDTAKATRLLKNYRISTHHPVFRLRAYIRTAPIAALEQLPRLLLSWRSLRRSGLPSLGDTIDSRASDSPSIAEQGLNDALRHYGQPINEIQTIAFHKRLARRNARAMQQALAFVSRPDFKVHDMFRTNFFAHLDWAKRRPVAAATLLAAALRNGYDITDLIDSRGYASILLLAYTNTRVRRVLKDVLGINNALAELFHSAPKDARAALAEDLYEKADEHARRAIVRWSHELPRAVAARLLRRALVDDSLMPEEQSTDADVDKEVLSGGFHQDVWFALVMCSQGKDNNFFRQLNLNLLEYAQRFSAPVAVAATLPALHRYAYEFREDLTLVHAVMTYLFDMAKEDRPNLREYVSKIICNFYGVMSPELRDRFFVDFKQTTIAATWALGFAVQNPSDDKSQQRALAFAREGPHRSAMAFQIYQTAGKDEHQLSATELTVIDVLLEHPDEKTLEHLSFAASEYSQAHPADATRLLLRIVHRATEIDAKLYTSYLMQQDWSTTPLTELEEVVDAVVAFKPSSYFILEVVTAGLSQQTKPEDLDRVSAAFEKLVSIYDFVGEALRKWRGQVATE